MQTNEYGYLVTEDGWWSRMAFSGLCAALAYSVVILMVLIMDPVLEPFWGFMVGHTLWILGIAHAYPYFAVAVPEATGLIVINQFRRATEEDNFANQRVFMVGLSPRYPWERKTSFIDLRQVVIGFKEDVPPQDGVLVEFRGSVIYNPRPDWLPIYIAVSKETIEVSLKDVATSYLTEEIAKVATAEQARSNAHDYEIGLKKHFEKVAEEQSFERRFGIDVTMVQMADVGFNEAFTKALNDRAIAKTTREMADEFRRENTGLSEKDAMNTALVVSGKTEKKIIELEGSQNIVNALAGLVAAFGGRSNQSSRS